MTRLLLVAAIVALATPSGRADPDPVALLRGVRTAREGLTGSLTCTIEETWVRPRASTGSAREEIAFEGSRRRVVTTGRALFLNDDKHAKPAPPALTESKSNEDVVREGYGQWESTRDRVIVDGGRVLYYLDQMYSAKFGRPGRGTYGAFTDPRLFGLGVQLAIGDTPASCLGYEDAQEVKLVGSEVIAGRTVWKVAVTRPAGLVKTFWVEDGEGFRVHRYEARVNTKDWTMTETAVSVYGPDRPPLPTRVDLEHDSGELRQLRQRYTVEQASYGAKPDSALFGLKGLDLKPGTPVEDENAKSLGYWDGERLQKKQPPKPRPAAVPATEPVPPAPNRWPVMVGVMAVVIAVGLVAWWRRRRPS